MTLAGETADNGGGEDEQPAAPAEQDDTQAAAPADDADSQPAGDPTPAEDAVPDDDSDEATPLEDAVPAEGATPAEGDEATLADGDKATLTHDEREDRQQRRRAAAAERLRAARRRRLRRNIIIAVAVVLVIGLGTGAILYFTRPLPVTVAGKFGSTPKVTIPSQNPPTTLQVSEPISGHGAHLAKGDLAIAKLTAYSWSGKTHKKLTALSSSKPVALTVGSTLKGLDKGLEGGQAGSRLLMTIPPAQGFGSQGNPEAGVSSNDTLVIVADVLGAYSKTSSAHGTKVPVTGTGLPTVGTAKPGAAPPVHIPTTAPPTTLQAKTLIQGTGPVVKKGQLLVAHYEGLIWASSKVFDSSWQRGVPASFSLASGQIINGWYDGLAGKRVGSQVLLVVPPADGYGSQGNSQAGIKGTDTLVFVVDILGAY